MPNVTTGWSHSRSLHLGLLVLVLGILAVLPFALVRFPPINDYPFHLARIVILAELDNPEIARFYAQGSFLLPNIALDAFSVPLAPLLGPENTVRLFVELTLVLTLVGAVALHATAHRRISVWPLLVFCLLHNGIFRFGFLNYLFGVALALIAGAVWMVLPRGLLRLAIALGACVALIFCHLEAFGVFAIIAAASEIQIVAVDWRQTRTWKPAIRLVESALPFVVTISLFFLVSPTARMTGSAIHYSAGLGTKFFGGLFSLSSGVLWLDGVTAFVLATLVVWLIWSRRLVISLPLVLAAIVMLLVLLALPGAILGGFYADARLGPALAILVLLSVDLRSNVSRRVDWSVAVIALCLAGVRVAVLLSTWVEYDAKIAPIVGALDQVEPGATLFAATTQTGPRLIADSEEERVAWQPPLKHVASYAVLHAPVFVPMTWSDSTQQPLVVRAPFADVKQFQGANPTIVTSGADLRAFVTAIDTQRSQKRWPQLSPAYLLVTGPALAGSARLPQSVRLVTMGNNYVLLKFRN